MSKLGDFAGYVMMVAFLLILGCQRDTLGRVQNVSDYKQLLDEVFVISGIIKVEVSIIS